MKVCNMCVKRLCILFIALIVLLSGCSSGCKTSNNNLVKLGVLPNGSIVYLSNNNLPLTESTPQTATISLVGGANNESFVIDLFISKQTILNRDIKSAESYGISVSPNPCILGTSGSGSPSSCEVTITSSAVTPVGTYLITPIAISASTGESTELSSVTVLVSGAVTPSTNAIIGYSLNGTAGVINGTGIAVTMPYGTSLSNLIATFITTGQSVTVNGVTQVDGVTPNDFTSPVTYTVTAADGSTQNYVVSVTVATNTAKAITAFSIDGSMGVINGTNIAVAVPFGTSLTDLIATFITTGQSVEVGATAQSSGVTPNDFTSPVTYTVTAADGSTQNYVVSVTVATNTAKAITAFSIDGSMGVINGTNIAVAVPFGTSLTDLIATFITTGQSVEVGATAQSSGVTPNDFTSPVMYTVTAANGTTQSYVVTVTVDVAPQPFPGFASAIGITLNSTGTLAYIVNRSNNTVTACNVSGGALFDCVDSGATSLDSPYGITLNSAGTLAYIVNNGDSTVTSCNVSGATLFGCVNSGATGLASPASIVLNSAGTTAYITNPQNYTVSACDVSGETLSGCVNSGATGLASPTGITLDSSGTTAYITNPQNYTVSSCVVIGPMLSSCVADPVGIAAPYNIALNSGGEIAYIPNGGANAVTACNVIEGTLSGCVDSGATGLDFPFGITLNSAGTTAYITNGGAANAVTTCDVSGMAFSNCVAYNGL